MLLVLIKCLYADHFITGCSQIRIYYLSEDNHLVEVIIDLYPYPLFLVPPPIF